MAKWHLGVPALGDGHVVNASHSRTNSDTIAGSTVRKFEVVVKGVPARSGVWLPGIHQQCSSVACGGVGIPNNVAGVSSPVKSLLDQRSKSERNAKAMHIHQIEAKLSKLARRLGSTKQMPFMLQVKHRRPNAERKSKMDSDVYLRMA